MATTQEAVLAAIGDLKAPDGRRLGDTGALSPVAVSGGRVVLAIGVEREAASAWEAVRQAAEDAIAALPGVERALVSLTAERAAGDAGADERRQALPETPAQSGFPSLAKVACIVAVASGKGGVGKSTTTVNLALALRSLGYHVGVLDADIYGPSLPKLFALKGRPRVVEGRTLAPLEAYGCKVMSIGFVVDQSKAMVWRGPMVASAITQMLRDVAWGELDILLVDMPPGTGDAQLTMAQQTPLSGAIIVSTPQDLALIDARRGVAMFNDVNVPIIGLIENMSYFVCDQCGKRHFIFAHGGARAEAERLGVPFLGEIPLDLAIRERSDAGLPLVATEPDGELAGHYIAIARQVAARLLGG